jgi:hypothetical protein
MPLARPLTVVNDADSRTRPFTNPVLCPAAKPFIDAGPLALPVSAVNGAEQVVPGVFGAGKANLDAGLGQFASVANDSRLTPSGDFAVDGWFRFDDLSETPTLHGQRDLDLGRSWDFFLNADGSLQFFLGGVGFFLTAGAGVVTEGQTHHILFHRYGTTWRIGVDGVIEATAVNAAVFPTFDGTFNIGAAWNGAFPFSGAFDEFHFQDENPFGTAGTYTVPTAAPTPDPTNTIFLLHCDNI